MCLHLHRLDALVHACTYRTASIGEGITSQIGLIRCPEGPTDVPQRSPEVLVVEAFCAWREARPVGYDAAMDRITRWVPELKDRFERAVCKVNVTHEPVASLEERAAGPTRKRTIKEVVEEAAPETERRWQRRKRTIDQLREFVQSNLVELPTARLEKGQRWKS